MVSSGMLRPVAFVRTDVSEEHRASFIRVTFLGSVRRLVVAASVVPSSPILVALMKEALVPPKRRFLQEPHGVASQKTPFFNLSAVQEARPLCMEPEDSLPCSHNPTTKLDTERH
jgi:hypothetical protein